MPAGKLNEKLAFERRSLVDDGAGNEVAGPFVKVFETAANIKPLKGSEAVQAARLQGMQPVVVSIHNSISARLVEADWQIRDTRTGRLYAITSPPVDMKGDRSMLEMIAVAGRAS